MSENKRKYAAVRGRLLWLVLPFVLYWSLFIYLIFFLHFYMKKRLMLPAGWIVSYWNLNQLLHGIRIIEFLISVQSGIGTIRYRRTHPANTLMNSHFRLELLSICNSFQSIHIFEMFQGKISRNSMRVSINIELRGRRRGRLRAIHQPCP